MRGREDKLRKRRSFFTILILFSFILSALPGGMRNIRAEELSGEEPVETVELIAEVIWTGLPEETPIPNTTLKLMSGEDVVESIEVTDGSLEVKFTPVAKFNDAGEEVLYSVSQVPLENFTTAIQDFVVENTYVEPVVVAEVVEEPVVKEPVEEPIEEPKVDEPVEEPKVEEPVEEPKVDEPVEEPKVEEPVEEPKVEEPVEEPKVEEPVEEPKAEEPVEEPKVEEPVEEPKVEEPVEEPKVEEQVEEPKVEEPVEEPKVEDELLEEVNLYEPSGSDGVIPAYATSDVPTYETLGKPEDKLTTFSTRSFSPMVMTTTSSMISPTVPGEVTIDKYAIPVPGLVNTWDITLRIEGMDSEKSSDIVLVIDRSGSMQGTRLAGAKTAAKAFVDAMANTPNTRIAVVSFASYYQGALTVTTDQSFLFTDDAENRDDLKDAIDSLVALGGTNTQAGIRRAATLLDGSTADIKNMVLLSDGEPTQSYALTDTDSWYEYFGETADTEGGNGFVDYRTRSDIPASAYNYSNTVGAGSDPYTYVKREGSYWTGYDYYYYSHGNSAISQASMFKGAGGDRTLWTIALDTEAYGDEVLYNIASPGKDYTAEPSDLNSIFLEIAGSISSAVRDAVVVDPMGPGFEIPVGEVGNISATTGTAVYDSITRKINWSFNALGNLNSNIKYAELNYRIHITDDILSIPLPDEQHLYPTNGDTEISYKDMDGVTQYLDFPIPVVNPIFLIVKKTLMDVDGNVITDPLRSFPIRIVSDDTDGDTIYSEYDNTYNLIPGEEVTKTNLRLADDYTVSEDEPDYDVTIKVDGVETSSFIVDPPVDGEDSAQNDIYVEVINKEKALGKLILEKLLVDKNGDPILNDTRTFTFNITGPDGYSETKTLAGGDTEEITGLEYGDYTVWETDPGTGFTVTYDPVQGTPPPPQTEVNVTLAWNNKEETVTVTNKYESPLTDVVAEKIWEGGPTPRPTVWFMLYRQIGEDGTAEPVPFDEIPGEDDIKELVNGVTQVSWNDITQTNNLGQLYIFSVREVNSEGQPFTPAYYTKTENGLTVTNTYTLTTVVVSKVVTGNMGDKTKEFTFTVTLEQGAEFPELGTGYTINPNNPSEATFTLKHEEEVTLIVPIGATLTIVESDNAGYTVSINGILETDSEWNGTVQSEGIFVEFTNNNDVIIDAGVALDSQPYMLVLALMGIGGVAGLIWKRKHLKFY